MKNMNQGVFMSLKISFDEIIENGLDYERKVFENLLRFYNILGPKYFKVVFLHKNLDTEDINKFVERNEKVLFHLNTKITGNDCSVWFAIERDETRNPAISYRYRYPGDILSGLVKYFSLATFLKGKYEDSDSRK